MMEESIRQITEIINSPRKQYSLIKNIDGWNQLCVCLDVIRETMRAIDAFTEIESETDRGKAYLYISGLLQALILQQDAVKHLCESLGISVSTDDCPELQEIRTIRHKSIGHPTKKTAKGKATY
ncbi:MAG: hypothetical protein DRP56_09290, partial [Planctomycetota bacterium]